MSLRDEMSNWLVGFMAGYGVRLDDGDARFAIEHSPLALPLSLLPPKGWRLVPEKATDAMAWAYELPNISPDEFYAIGDAMISAAPVTKTEGGGNG